MVNKAGTVKSSSAKSRARSPSGRVASSKSPTRSSSAKAAPAASGRLKASSGTLGRAGGFALGRGAKAPLGQGAPASSREQQKSAAPGDPALLAMQMLGRWTRMAQGHIALGGGCNCCGDFGNVQVKDMEQHILDYLDTKYRAGGAEPITRLLAERAGYRSSEAGSIADLLRAMAGRAEVGVSKDQQLALLADLGRSIDSLDQMLQGG